MNNITLIPNKKLKAHEKTSEKNLCKVIKLILKSKYFNEPIIVDKKNLIILDGHHRTKALSDLGFNKIPAYLIDYNDDEVTVTSRRKKISITKEKIITAALNNKLYPIKTSRHHIPHRPKNLKIKLKELI